MVGIKRASIPGKGAFLIGVTPLRLFHASTFEAPIVISTGQIVCRAKHPVLGDL